MQKLSAEVAKVTRRPDVAEQLRVAGIEPIGGTPEQMDVAIKEEARRVAIAAKRANLKAD